MDLIGRAKAAHHYTLMAYISQTTPDNGASNRCILLN